MSETPRFAGNQDHQVVDVELLFLGAEAPPLDGEELCICGQLEGEHRSDGTYADPNDDLRILCGYFVAADEAEEKTNPEIRVEYDAGCEPAGAR